MYKSIIGMANINAQELQSIKIFLLPVSLQNKFELIYQQMTTKLKTHNAHNIETETLFKALQQEFFE